ncbi:hypothetical protein [Jeotgalibacillus aurantiacus]|uniref:hypothetical protein n=1 Tax=Jeotgalibacillus aurantiacus TaxID=2763266 RepID=UPI001D0AC365|nr:hypothetical protein [Jeotgalibacillus aurantiacus]
MDLKQTYQRQVEQEVTKFRKAVDKINESDHPTYSVPGARDYEISELIRELERKVKEIDIEFREQIEGAIEHQTKVAMRSQHYVSATDREFIKQASVELKTALTFAGNKAEVLDAINAYESRLETLESESAFSEVIKQLAEIMPNLSDDFAKQKVTHLYRTLSRGLQTPEQAQLEELKQAKITGVKRPFTTLKMTHPAFKHIQAARRSTRY